MIQPIPAMDVYDNVLEEHVAEFIQSQMNDLSWKYDYYSKIAGEGITIIIN